MNWRTVRSLWCMGSRRFGRSTQGNTTIIMALAAVPVLMAITGVVDLSDMSSKRAKLQEAADAGALTGAGQLAIASTTSNMAAAQQAAVSVAQDTLSQAKITAAADFAASVDTQKGAVTVTGRMEQKPLIGFADLGVKTISVTATAENLQKIPLCVLQTGSGGGIDLRNSANIRASGCAVHANQNIDIASGALIKAEAVQAVGTVTGPTDPQGNSGALPIPDPFAAMNLAPTNSCSLKGPLLPVQLLTGTMTLPAGTHCSPIVILGSATLQLAPGEHYFLAPLIMTGNSTLRGDDVALIFGIGNTFNFAQQADVRLTARKSGPFAGFLIATSRDNVGTFTIGSGKVSELLGTIYTPNATLVVDTAGNVAQDSAWSVIVAKSLTLKQSPVLVINNNYVGSGVPVPEGVGPSKSAPVLSQ